MAQEKSVYWQLVAALTHFGWYREGCDRDRDPSGHSWRFREGHLTEGRRGDPLWISATDEETAMRVLLEQLQRADAARRDQVGSASE